jgi:hypothetical protein
MKKVFFVVIELDDRDRHDRYQHTHNPWKRPEKKKEKTNDRPGPVSLIPCSFLFYSSIHHNLAYRLLTPPLSCGILGPCRFLFGWPFPSAWLGLDCALRGRPESGEEVWIH